MPKAETEQVVVIRVDGKTYEFRPERVTGTIAGRVRQATGMSVAKAAQLLADDPDLDVFSALIFAAALQADRNASFDDIAGSITYGSSIEVDAGDDDDPEP